MKNNQTLIVILGTLFISGCAAVPRQVVDALEMQQRELERVKAICFVNMNNQLDAIEKYRLAILDIYEEHQIAKHCKALNQVSIDGVFQIVEIDPTGDIDLDHINVAKLGDIQNFFKAERAKVVMDINSRRKQILLANQNFENIENINLVMNDYMQSLTRLKNSQDKLAVAIKNQMTKLVPIPFSLDNIPDPQTIEEIVTLLTVR